MNYVDEYFCIGVMHVAEGKSCQDHALSYVDELVTIGCVSDGCSQGGKTDIGARILNCATIQTLRNISFSKEDCLVDVVAQVQKKRMVLVQKIQQELNLNDSDLLATSLYAYISEEGTFVHISGDGVLALIDEDGNMDVRKFSWEKNAPYYPAYDLGQREQFSAFHGGNDLLECLKEERWQISQGEINGPVKIIYHTVAKGLEGIIIDLLASAESVLLKYIVLFSDGIEQIDGLEWLDAVKACVNYKTDRGVFVKRRMIRFLKEVTRIGKGPLDDLSCVAIHLAKQSEENGGRYDGKIEK